MRDVRMRGFAGRVDVADVDAYLRRAALPLGEEDVALLECVGRVLTCDVVSPVDVPDFARSAMDGYAVRGEDTFGASAYAPLELALIGEAYPAAPFGGEVGSGEAVRIMTGAPVPGGADAVIMAEYCAEEGTRVSVQASVSPRKHIGVPGEDIRTGETMLRAGRRLRAQDAGLLASMGLASVKCVRRPRVRLVVTGNELLPAGAQPGGCRIVDSNSVVLRSLVERDGGTLLPFEILPDDPDRIRDALSQSDADLLLVSGGSSVGAEDHAPRLVSELGKLEFHGVAMRPSSPSGIGRIDDRFVFLLPGNPVSCLCSYEFFAGPTLRALGGRSRRWPHRRLRLPLGRKLASEVGRTDYVRVAIEDGAVFPIATSGASILSSTVRASGAVVVPLELEGMAEGATVEVLLYDEEKGPDEGDAER